MKKVFLTGASSGIGSAITHALLKRGYEIWGTSRDPARLPQHRNFHPVQIDLRHQTEIDGAFLRSLHAAGHFDVVINNGGSGHFGAAEFLSISEMADQFQVFFFAQVRLMQLALAEMRPRDSGLIINVTSLAERLPVEDGWADVVISNGVINLCADKKTAFAEIYRVLRPGGRLQFADIANGKPVPESAIRDIDLWTA